MNDKKTGVDMSPEAIDRRMRTLSGLWKFGQSLKGAKRLGRTRDLKAAASGQNTKDHGQDREEQGH